MEEFVVFSGSSLVFYWLYSSFSQVLDADKQQIEDILLDYLVFCENALPHISFDDVDSFFKVIFVFMSFDGRRLDLQLFILCCCLDDNVHQFK